MPGSIAVGTEQTVVENLADIQESHRSAEGAHQLVVKWQQGDAEKLGTKLAGGEGGTWLTAA